MPEARPSHHGARLPQRAAPVTPRAHPVRARRTSLLWTWQAGVTGGTRGRRWLATARGPRGRSEADPSGAGARLAAPATAGAHSQRARSSIAL